MCQVVVGGQKRPCLLAIQPTVNRCLPGDYSYAGWLAPHNIHPVSGRFPYSLILAN